MSSVLPAYSAETAEPPHNYHIYYSVEHCCESNATRAHFMYWIAWMNRYNKRTYVLYYLCSLLARLNMWCVYNILCHSPLEPLADIINFVSIHCMHDMPHDGIPIGLTSRNVLYTYIDHWRNPCISIYVTHGRQYRKLTKRTNIYILSHKTHKDTATSCIIERCFHMANANTGCISKVWSRNCVHHYIL